MEMPDDVDMLRDLIDKFDKNPNVFDDLSEDELAKMAKAASIYGDLPNKGNEKYSVIAITYLQKEWQNAMALMGTIGYMYNKLQNYAPEPPEEIITGDPVEFKNNYAAAFRESARRFLDDNFRFNPEKHISKFGDKFKIEEIEIPYEPFKGQGDYLAIHQGRLQAMLQAHFFKYPPMTDYIMNVYASNLPLKEAEEKYNAAKKLTNMPLFLVEEGRHTVYGDDPRVRNNLDIDAPGNEVLQAVMDRIKNDAETRKNILKQTVRRAKLKNIKEMGPDDADFNKRVSELHPDRQINSLTEAEIGDLNREYKKYQMEKMRKEGETIVPMVSIDEVGKATEMALYTRLEQYLKTG